MAPEIKPSNDVSEDGFVLLRIDRTLLIAIESEADKSLPEFAWLKSRFETGKRLVIMGVGCNHAPIIVVWERQPTGKWLILGFVIPGV